MVPWWPHRHSKSPAAKTQSDTKGREVTIDKNITLYVPRQDRCWDFGIVYACGHPVMIDKGCCRNVEQRIRVKRGNHHRHCSLKRCVVATQNHKLPEKCTNCEITDLRFQGVHVPQ
ncbi:hypothetical protein F5Y12DRAFT_764920 [Xylaria sp. FL1777]|nr:hypothetical protein F5Y12DRAFT_764920 [Xylaria sp. FL1777]